MVERSDPSSPLSPSPLSSPPSHLSPPPPPLSPHLPHHTHTCTRTHTPLPSTTTTNGHLFWEGQFLLLVVDAEGVEHIEYSGEVDFGKKNVWKVQRRFLNFGRWTPTCTMSVRSSAPTAQSRYICIFRDDVGSVRPDAPESLKSEKNINLRGSNRASDRTDRRTLHPRPS